MFKKLEENGRDPCIALLEYRNTPIDNNIKSPNEIMFGRKIRGILWVENLNENTVDYNEIKNRLFEKQVKQKMYYYRNSHALRPVRVHEDIYVRRGINKPLEQGKITGVCERPRSYEVKLNNGSVIQRNRIHIYPYTDANVTATKAEVNEETASNTSNCIKDTNNKSNVGGDKNVSPTKDKNDSIASEQNMCTRSGRAVKPPAHLKDYVCTK